MRRSAPMTKQKVLFLIAIFISLALLSACALDDCAINNWGTLSIENQSQSGRAYKILIDGINYGIVGAGDTKEFKKLAAGPHVVQILFADTGYAACSVSVPTIIKCQTSGLRCSS